MFWEGYGGDILWFISIHNLSNSHIQRNGYKGQDREARKKRALLVIYTSTEANGGKFKTKSNLQHSKIQKY